jgi:hypothetical protein
MALQAKVMQQQQTSSQPSSSSMREEWPRPTADAQILGSGAVHDLHGGIDWDWLVGLQRSQRFGPVLRVDIEVGTTNGLLPAKYAVHDRLMAQVRGAHYGICTAPCSVASQSA